MAHHNQPRPLAPDPRHVRVPRKTAIYFPYFTIQPAPLEAAAQTDLLAVHHARHHRRPSGMASSSRATASPKTIKLRDGTIKSHDDIPEDRHERQARRALGRRPCRGVGLRPRALPQHAVSARQRYQRSTTTWGRHHPQLDHRRGREWKKQIPRTEFTYIGWAEGFHCMRDKPPAPHFKHILSEREEHFHEDTAATSRRKAAALRQDYDITLHQFESYHECMQYLSRDSKHKTITCGSDSGL